MDTLTKLSHYNLEQICKGCHGYEDCLKKAQNPDRTLGKLLTEVGSLPIAVTFNICKKIGNVAIKITAIKI